MDQVLGKLRSGETFAGYRIESLVGRGGMGLVYEAHDPRAQRTVAVKVLAPDLSENARFRARFEREARIAAEIEHPNVIPIYDVGAFRGQLYLVMRFVKGADLGRLVIDHGRFAADHAARLTAQIAAALDAAHARDLVHRDVKPANVLISGTAPEEHLYLTDFGVTTRIGDAGPRLTAAGGFVGTLDYVAPEQIAGDAVDGRADVYALGCVLYELLTGAPPFSEMSRTAKIQAHLSAPVPSCSRAVPGLSHEFDSVIERALAKSPDDRFSTAGALARAAIEAAAHTAGVFERAAAETSDGQGDEVRASTEEARSRSRASNVSVAGKNVYNGPISVEGDFHG